MIGDISWERNVTELAAYLITRVARQPATFDVFLCHNSRDKPIVRNIAAHLRKMGLKPWLDEVDLRPGVSSQRQLDKEISRANAAAVFVGADGFGPWEDIELHALLQECVKRGIPVIPVLLENAPQGREPELPPFLRDFHWVDFRKPRPESIQSTLLRGHRN